MWLHDAGYETALVGKYLNDYTVYGAPPRPAAAGRTGSRWTQRPEEKYYDYTLNENGRLVHYGTATSDYSTDVLAGKAIDFVRSAKGPFFLYFAPIAPHLPALPAAARPRRRRSALPKPRPDFDERDLSDKPWHGLYQRVYSAQAVDLSSTATSKGRQLRSLHDLDRQVGALMGALKQKGVLDNTIVIYASDNGFLWGEHRLGGKLWPYEESIRVPLVIRVPWQRASGRTDSHMVLEHRPRLDDRRARGRQARPAAGRAQPRAAPPAAGRLPGDTTSSSSTSARASSKTTARRPSWALRTKRWLYVEYRNGWRELYDLRHDPYELQNLSKDSRFRTLERRLELRLHVLASR